ncbi:hypothetical protein WEU38_02325 [Cyanobacterium aponinum AL20118]|uniref:DNA methyltransferase n=1 Tax=Cyanobacterium aponinum AL20115 TaxID=3090662 RepID=A0AAF1C1Y6_9CHRO|nr:hypothetical protein [Cyanobacterium aponinum]WPF89137.1 hypothetical protein SAY89_02340 [Cyanobacterium aponinum AL20115]
MNYKELLISIYQEVIEGKSYSSKINNGTLKNIEIIAKKCFSQKGVYTVLVTLIIYKILHPEQDIRNHQAQIEGGFSGRVIDTQYISPTLRELGLPAMAESGWTTRSLEQPYPYTLDYQGRIGNKQVKKAFLELLDTIQNQKINPKYILHELLTQIIAIQQLNKVVIQPLNNAEKLTINKIIKVLDSQFSFNYKIFGGSKLPVLAFYSLYQVIITEISRYNNCQLKQLGSHTASDKRSKTAGDIEIFNNDKLFEVLEIKLDKQVDLNIIRIAREKIIKYNPQRYYVLSYLDVKEEERKEIDDIIEKVKYEHGCQMIVNGVIPTLKYYLRLISKLDNFINAYSRLIQDDLELKSVHKQKWIELLKELENDL